MRTLVITLALFSIVLFSFTTLEHSSIKTTEDYLTSKTWKFDELRTVYRTNKFVYYKRDVFGTELDSDSMRLFPDNTAEYYSQGKTYRSSWNFIGGDKTKLKLTINTKPAQTVFWENINVTETHLKYVQYDSPTTEATYLAYCVRTAN